MLSPEMLALLRQWWKVRPTRWDASVPPDERWLFPGRKPGQPMTTRQLNRLFHETADRAGIRKGVCLHSLRHYVASRTMSRTFDYGPVSWRKSSVGRDIVSPLLSTCAGEGVDREVYRQRSGGSVTRAGRTSGALHCLVFEVGDRAGIRAVLAAEADSNRCRF